MFRNKDVKYIESVLRAISNKCKNCDSCKLCGLTDFCADRPFTGITSDDFCRNVGRTVIPVIENNGNICMVSLKVFLEYLHKKCTEKMDTSGCARCPLKECCNNTICFTTTPSIWNI